MDDGARGPFSIIYDGSKQASVFSFVVGNLTTGSSYRFKLQSVNINGNSADSPVTLISACLTPTNLSVPYLISTSTTAVMIGWNPPIDNGCPILSYNIFRDTGNNDALAIDVDPANVHNKPSLREYEIQSLSPTGSTFRFKIRAINADGYIDSYPLEVVLASVPDTPLVGPISDASITNQYQIGVDYDSLTPAQSGGSNIISYELQMDNGKGGDFISLVGLNTDNLDTYFTVTSNIQEGVYYRFRYRARNVNGWSGYSPITYIQAATIPIRPPAPLFVTANSTAITLRILPSTNTRGSVISKYNIYRNQGGNTNCNISISSYSGMGDATITAADGIVPDGTIYQFKVSAQNSFGYSDLSDYVLAAMSDFPDQPSPPV